MRKNIFKRLFIFYLAVLTALPLPAFAVEPENESVAVEQLVETTDSSEQTTEESQDPKPDEKDEPFDCWVSDAQGGEIKGYWAEEKNAWYLFLPSTQSISDTVLYYSGSVNDTSSGELSQEAGTVTGAFTTSGDRAELTMADGSICSIVVMQSSLPSVCIKLSGTTLDEIHASKDIKHGGNSVSIMDPNGIYDLDVQGSVEVKGRGNSTWRLYEKKGYQIKFSEKTSVLGMGKAKKWVLLASAGDDSMMRTELIYEMADELEMGYVPSMEYVDLWIDGEYRGTYMIGEKVELGSSRLDLSNDTGALFEHDEAFYAEEDYWFYNTMLQRHFVMKEIVNEESDVIESAIADFDASVDELASYLYSTPSKEANLEDLSKMIDVDSFIKYYLVNEYALNREAFASSFYWYKDGAEDVIHLGPIWDFDTCMGNEGFSYTESYGQNHVLFRYLMAIPEFYDRTQELYEIYQSNLHSMTTEVSAVGAQIASSADMNYIRWDVLGKPNPKGGSDFEDSFEDAALSLQEWLKGRENGFTIAKSRAVTSAISEDCYNMDICFQDDQDYSGVRFAVWSLEKGQDDLKWYTATKSEDGSWRSSVDLSKHNSAGMYRIDAHADGTSGLLATGMNYVQTAREPLYQTHVEVSENCEEMSISMQDSGLCSKVTFAVWSAENGQNDLQWYPAEKDSSGNWICNVDLRQHHSAGLYYIHAYSESEGQRKVVDVCTAEVATATGSDKVDYETVVMYRLYNPNTGEHFFTGSEEERDNLVTVGWNFEGDAWNAPVSTGEAVYRLYNPNTGDHHYTMSQEEVQNLEEVGWKYEGVAWNCAPADDPESVAQYRLFNPNAESGIHHYTSSEQERDHLVEEGWRFEGIGWYGRV